MSCKSKTHELVIKTLGSQVLSRVWIRLADGQPETDAAILAQLEASILTPDCDEPTPVSSSCDDPVYIRNCGVVNATKHPVCFEHEGGVYKGWEIEKFFEDGSSTVEATDRGRTFVTATFQVIDCPCDDEPARVPNAVDDPGNTIPVGEPRPISVALNDTPCPNGELTTFVLIPGSEVNVIVTPPSINYDGMFDVTVQAEGAWSFEYEIHCDGVPSGETALVSGEGVDNVNPTDDNMGLQEVGTLVTVNTTPNDALCPAPSITTWAIVPGSEINATVVNNNDGTFDVIPLANGPFEFYYELICDGVPTGETARVYGSGVTPDIELLKEADVQGLGVEGDTILYTFTVENTGNTTLTNIVISDPLVTIVGGPIASLAPGAVDSTTFTASYVITAADILAGEVSNQALVTGTPPNGIADVTDNSDDPSNPNSDDDPTVVIVPETDIELLKEAINLDCVNCNTVPVPIDIATGQGPVGTLDPNWQVQWIPAQAPTVYDGISYYDPGTNPIQQAYIIGNLAPGAWGNAPAGTEWISFDFSSYPGGNGPGDHPNVDNDGVVNEYTPDNPPISGPTGDAVQLRFFRNVFIPEICNGDNLSVDVTFVSDNQIMDVLVNGVSNGPANDTSFNPVSYSISNGWQTGNNVLEVIVDSGPPLVGFIVTSGVIQCEQCDCPSFEAGETIDYAFTVTNTGVVDLTNVIVTDPIATVVGGPIPLLPAGASDSTTFTASYTITPADIAAGGVTNQATVTGTNPDGLPVSDLSDDPNVVDGDPNTPTFVEIPPTPAMTVLKEGVATSDGSITSVEIGGVFVPIATGQTLTLDNGSTVTLLADGTLDYSRTPFDVTQNFIAENTNWTLPPISDISEPSYDPDWEQYDARSLTYTNLQGQVIDELRFSLQPTGTFDDSIALDLNGDGTIDWVATQGDASVAVGGTGPGLYSPWLDASPYYFEVVVTATGTTVTATWNGTPIIPGAYTGGGSPQQDAGFDNVSGLTLADLGFNPDGSIPSNNFTTTEIRVGNINDAGIGGHGFTWQLADAFQIEDTVTIQFTDTSGTVVKDLEVVLDENTPYPVNVNPYNDPAVGDTILYTFTVTNTGNVDLTNVQITDPLVTVVGGPLALLPVGASDSTTFTASYTLTQADMYAGEVQNQATAIGSSPLGVDDVSALSTGTVTCTDVESSLSVTLADPDLGPYVVDLGIGGTMSFVATAPSRFSEFGVDGPESLVVNGNRVRTNIISPGGFGDTAPYQVELDVNISAATPAKLVLHGGDTTSGGFVNHYDSITLTWTGGTAELIDPDNQIVGGSRFVESGDQLVQALTDPSANILTWQLVFPLGVTDVNIVAPNGQQLEVFYWTVVTEDCVVDAPAPTVVTYPAEPLPTPPGDNIDNLDLCSHFSNSTFAALFDGNTVQAGHSNINDHRLHQDCLMTWDFATPYTASDSIQIYWSNAQQSGNDPDEILGLEIQVSSDGGATTTSYFTPTELVPNITGDQVFDITPGIAFNWMGIRSIVQEDVGADPYIWEITISNIPNV